MLTNFNILDSDKQLANVKFIKMSVNNDCAAGPSGINKRDDHQMSNNEESDDQSSDDSEPEIEEKKPKRSKASGGPAPKKPKIKGKEKKLLLKRKKANERKVLEREGWEDKAFKCKRCTMSGYPGCLLFKGKDTLGRHTQRIHKTKLPYDKMETIPWAQTKGWRYALLKSFGVSEGVKP